MPFRQIPDTHVRYALIAFDKSGEEISTDPDGQGDLFSKRLLADTRAGHYSHIFFFAHGWKGDIPAAKEQYDLWMTALANQMPNGGAPGAGFSPLWIGLHWPSLPWGEEEIQGASFGVEVGTVAPAASDLVETYLDRLSLGEAGRPPLTTIIEAQRRDPAAESLPPEAENAYNELAGLIGRNAGESTGTPDVEDAAFIPQDAFQGGQEAAVTRGSSFGLGGMLLGGILNPLRQLSFWNMKKRARLIGEGGMHTFVSALMSAAPTARVHLMGHSFGCIVVSSILGGKPALPRPVDSVVLVQGAVSLWCYADKGKIPQFADPGYYYPVRIAHVVRGPLVVTRSRFDKAVGFFYPLAAKAAFWNGPSFAFASSGDADFEEADLPRFGGLGAFGLRGAGATDGLMLPKEGNYHFEAGKIYNLESSQFIAKGTGSSGAHSDIAGPEVAHMIWQAAQV